MFSAMASVVDKEQNVKRESKAYSYEEQQWDRELREVRKLFLKKHRVLFLRRRFLRN